MNLKTGAIIKKLRTENNVTQEALAAALGVTPQAISRWELGSGYPDIEFLPMLADFFGVSTDELLGYRRSEREEELTTIKKELERLAEIGTHEQRLSFCRSAFVKYPGDYEIKIWLASCLIDEWEKTKEEALLNEAETLCKSVIDGCRDEEIRYEAVCTLSTLYTASGKIDRARHTLEMLTPMKYCREFVLSCGIGDGNTEWYIQDEIDKLTDCLGTAIAGYAVNDELPNDPSRWDRKIQMLRISNELYRMIYGDHLMFNHVRLSRNHWLISTYQAAQGKTEEALASLEEMCRHAILYDKSYREDHGKYYTSIFTDKLIYPDPGRAGALRYSHPPSV